MHNKIYNEQNSKTTCIKKIQKESRICTVGTLCIFIDSDNPIKQTSLSQKNPKTTTYKKCKKTRKSANNSARKQVDRINSILQSTAGLCWGRRGRIRCCITWWCWGRGACSLRWPRGVRQKFQKRVWKERMSRFHQVGFELY